jgi:murein lipoprotein
MTNKFLLIAGVSSMLLLGGCASDLAEQTADEVAGHEARISQLEQDIAASKDAQMEVLEQLKEATQEAQAEAARANDRLDNIAQSYTK